MRTVVPWSGRFTFTRHMNLRQFWAELTRLMTDLGPDRSATRLRRASADIFHERNLTRNLARNPWPFEERESALQRFRTVLVVLPIALQHIDANPFLYDGTTTIREIWPSRAPPPPRGYENLSIDEFFYQMSLVCRELGGDELRRVGRFASNIAKSSFERNQLSGSLKGIVNTWRDPSSVMSRFWILSSAYPTVVGFMSESLRSSASPDCE